MEEKYRKRRIRNQTNGVENREKQKIKIDSLREDEVKKESNRQNKVDNT